MLNQAYGTFIYWATGYAFAYGGNGNGFIGYKEFFLAGTDSKNYPAFFFSYVFSITAATIVSGALAERGRLLAYTCHTLLITGFTYPVVTHWVWSQNGWLKQIGYVVSISKLSMNAYVIYNCSQSGLCR